MLRNNFVSFCVFVRLLVSLVNVWMCEWVEVSMYLCWSMSHGGLLSYSMLLLLLVYPFMLAVMLQANSKPNPNPKLVPISSKNHTVTKFYCRCYSTTVKSFNISAQRFQWLLMDEICVWNLCAHAYAHRHQITIHCAAFICSSSWIVPNAIAHTKWMHLKKRKIKPNLNRLRV